MNCIPSANKNFGFFFSFCFFNFTNEVGKVDLLCLRM